MKRISINQKGSLHIAALLGLVVLATMVFAGYHVYQTNKQKSETTATTNSTKQFSSTSDLKAASKSLDADESSTAVDPTQLDADLNSIL